MRNNIKNSIPTIFRAGFSKSLTYTKSYMVEVNYNLIDIKLSNREYFSEYGDYQIKYSLKGSYKYYLKRFVLNKVKFWKNEK